jgi:hypothetical protein
MADKQRDLKRRDFLKKGLAGLAAVGAAPSVLRPGSGPGAAGTQAASAGAGAKPIVRALGKTGMKIPVVSMGVMNSDNPNLVREALDSGIRFLDTAHGYQRGRNEQMIGEVVKGRPRDSFYLATKVPGPNRNRSMQGVPKEEAVAIFLRNFDTSLGRLGLDYVDILYCHNVDKREHVLDEVVIEALQTAKKSGKARFVGVTTHSHEPEVIRAAVEAGVYDVVLSAYNFRQDHREELRKAVAEAAKTGLGVIAMKTQAGAYWDKEKQQPINMRAALKWVLNDPNVTTAIPGFTTFDQLREDLTVMTDLKLTPEELHDLRLDQQAGGLYCQQCEQCLSGCPQGLPIPTLMRGYMYAYGYRNLALAHEVVTSLELPSDPCASCAACGTACVKGFDLKERISDIARLRNVPPDFFA